MTGVRREIDIHYITNLTLISMQVRFKIYLKTIYFLMKYPNLRIKFLSKQFFKKQYYEIKIWFKWRITTYS